MKLALIPHGANQYRPHLIRRYGLLVLLLLIVGIQAGYNVSTSGVVLGTKAPIASSDLLDDTNRERVKKGLEPLIMNAKLSEAAYMKVQDMLNRQYWAHEAPDGTTPWQWLTKAGYNYASAGENLAKNFSSSGATVTAWMASPEHRDNVLNARYDEAGFATADGVLDGQPVTLVVALYGQSADGAVVAGVRIPSQEEIATSEGTIGPLTRFAIGLDSMTPAALAAVLLLIAAALVAVLAHVYRNKLPKRLRESWYRHHGIMKASGMVSLIVIMLALYSGGQI